MMQSTINMQRLGAALAIVAAIGLLVLRDWWIAAILILFAAVSFATSFRGRASR